jgi:hypothetical protein
MIKFLDVNTDASVVFANKLEKMHRSGYPRAIRESLSQLALKLKQVDMPNAVDAAFDDRTNKRFFRANSSVSFAKGWDVDRMESQVGFLDTKLKGGNNYSVQDLEKQEKGGIILGRAYIPLKRARVSNNYMRVTRKKFRIADIKKKVVDSKNAPGSTNQEKWIQSVIFAGEGGFVIGLDKTGGGNRILWHIRKIGRRDGDTFAAATPIYAVKGQRRVAVGATRFMEKASKKTATRMDWIFEQEAKKAIKRLRNR